MSVVLITGAATSIGNLTAKTLAAARHTVHASMRDLADHARDLRDIERLERTRRDADTVVVGSAPDDRVQVPHHRLAGLALMTAYCW